MSSCFARFVLALIVVVLTVSFTTSFTPAVHSPTFRTASTSRRRNTAVWGAATLQRDLAVTNMAAPATLEKELVRTSPSGPAVLERPDTARKERVEEPRKEKKGMGSEAWEVRIYNDGLNTREHVARSLVQVTGMSEMDAYQTMMQAHLNGLATVGRYIYEVAEMFHDALKKNGIVCDIVPVDED